MNMLTVLAIILFILMVLVGGRKGARSFIALFFNLGVLLLTTLFMTDPNVNPIYLTIIACAFISCINLFYINKVNSKTKVAFVSTVITITILIIFINLITKNAMIQGFGEEEVDELNIFSLYISVAFVIICIYMFIMITIC